MTATDRDIDTYVEESAGLDAIAGGLRLLPSTSRSVIDVGCGYGFGVDLARTVLGWRAVGVEPSYAGRRGAADLGVDIHRDLLTTEPIEGAPYDAAIASEVLEHLTDPVSFLRAVRAQLTPTGTLALTTPAAEAVDSGASSDTIDQVLSIPLHHFIASEAGLRTLLTRAGFGSSDVRRHGIHLVAVAGVDDRPVQAQSSPAITAEELERYLVNRTQGAELGSALELGSAVRGYRSMVARGAFDDAVEFRNTVSMALERRAGCRLDLEVLCRLLDAEWRTPLALPGAAYATAMICMLHDRDQPTARRWFDVAERSVTQLREARLLLGGDSLDILVQSIGHGALCAATDPHGRTDAVAAIERLGGHLDSHEVDWWRCRVFVEAAAAGCGDTADALLDDVAPIAHDLARSTTDPHRRTGLDTLFIWGVSRLNRGDAAGALALFEACADLCAAAPPDAHAEHLRGEALRHLALARTAATGATAPTIDDSEVAR